ncbi:methylaspartate mutase [Rhodococcus sp. 14-2470-1a]|uniref:methylaspartate mutase n=1 Tax=Rhodococcus sp. 14-2470-1a TaxID=2023150 RepID=UPI000B9C1D86|nr:methylaspartate mutase [Rhodococcus sp. 14-2470-1a]OZF56623.1 methylaspartate mutase [Rhodococcus sp. 14-2470-1a]
MAAPASTIPTADTGFGAFVARAAASGLLVVQPRMGMSDPGVMRRGLAATKNADGCTVGTVTLDSYTRVGDLDAARLAVLGGEGLNGYPIVTHDDATTRAVLDGIRSPEFPVQVRHGSATPFDIFTALIEAGIDASEGGPVSYCLPYGRVPLETSIDNWARSCARFAESADLGMDPHLETFGGCMLGQLCPPSLLVAISALEAYFFHYHGIRNISASYAQQTDFDQDVEAVTALRRLCGELIPSAAWHVVIYAYMGVYPSTPSGAYSLLGAAARLAKSTGCERLIVKTEAESLRIPTIEENVSALEHAAAEASRTAHGVDLPLESQTYTEARALVTRVLELNDDPGRALLEAFRRGYLDVPYCLHPDNRGLTRSYIDDSGRLHWGALGNLPLGDVTEAGAPRRVTSALLLSSLGFVSRHYDGLPS